MLNSLQLLRKTVPLKTVFQSKASIVIGMILVLILFGIIRACTTSAGITKPTYRIARDSTWYPLDLSDKGRSMVGFSNDLIMEIATRQKFNVEFFFDTYEHLMPGLDLNQYDGILSSLTPTSTIKESYDFSEPFYLLGPVLVTQNTANYTSLEQMSGKIIGIPSGSSMIFDIETFPAILIRSYDNPITALSDLNNHLIDGAILNMVYAYTYATGIFKGKLKIVTEPMTDYGLRMVTRHDPSSDHLIQMFNDGLQSLEKDGTYSHLLQKWGLFNPLEPEKTAVPAVAN